MAVKKKNNIIEVEIDTCNKTPIEIALKIDENGMTSLKNLYTFLELETKNYARWCRKHILNNPFATENVDYIVVRQFDERFNPKPTNEYLLTSDFAKQLSMTVNNERGYEARQYFLACEQGLKIATQKLQTNFFDQEAFTKAISEAITLAISPLNDRIIALEEQMFKKKTPVKKYSRWKTNTFHKLNRLMVFVNDNTDEDLQLSDIIHLVIGEMEDSYKLELNEYVDAYKSEFDIEGKPYVIDVINHYQNIKEAFSSTLDEIMRRLKVIAPEETYKPKNIFDVVEEKLAQN